ncbi:hypothetical protein BKA70DRAFT_796810 [Coprinopsis sp. MPI-PUGE-AT-0042]|nr:hypothetical protein BKA70DRAFT_796810 [Coprinopsis sp. MPI-PUGE-AT-0042]
MVWEATILPTTIPVRTWVPLSLSTNTLGHSDPSAGLRATSFNSVDNGLSQRSGAYTSTDTTGRETAGERTKDTTAHATSGAGNATTAPGFGMGHTAGVHPETHPTYGKDDGSKAAAAGDNSTMGSSTLGKSSSPSPSSDSKGEKKPGFMSKLKGEVKVISGKLGHNEAKIEEGRKLMGKN